VINYGVPGYSAENNFDSVKHALADKADLVILQITLNDPQKKQIRPTGLQFTNKFGSTKTAQQNGIARYWKTLGFVMERLHNTKTTNNSVQFYFDLFETDMSWDFLKKHVKLMKRHCRAKHVPFVAVVFPLFGLPLDEHYPFHSIHQKLGEFLNAKSIRYLDLFGVFKNIPLNRIQVIPGVDFHPNEFGHRLAAEALFLWLRDKKILPAEIREAESDLLIDDRWKTLPSQ
jgi:lysophospholipase L1-like esterase